MLLVGGEIIAGIKMSASGGDGLKEKIVEVGQMTSAAFTDLTQQHGFIALAKPGSLVVIPAGYVTCTLLPEGTELSEGLRWSFTRELGKSRSFTVVDSPGPDVLLVSGHIVNLQISAPPLRDQEPDERVYTSSSGQMTLVLDARDATSGEPLVRVGEAHAIEMAGGGWYESDPVSNSAAVREVFDRWAESLRRELDQFHALPALPPVDVTPPTS